MGCGASTQHAKGPPPNDIPVGETPQTDITWVEPISPVITGRALLRTFGAEERVSASDLCDAVERLGDLGGPHEAVAQLLRASLDAGEGLDAEALETLLHPPTLPDPSCPESLPHLELFFDVNQTILVLDSAAGIDEEDVLNMIM